MGTGDAVRSGQLEFGNRERTPAAKAALIMRAHGTTEVVPFPVALLPIMLFAPVLSRRAFAGVLFPVLLLRVAPCQVRLPKTARYS